MLNNRQIRIVEISFSIYSSTNAYHLMKSFGTVIDESIQNNQQLIPTHQRQHSKQSFPKRQIVNNPVQSYAAVLQQSIITQDKPLLKDIITSSDHQMLVNSAAALNVSKISPFLKLLQELLVEDCQNTQIYAKWLRELVSRHMGVILSNPENKEIVLRLRRWIEKRISSRKTLLQLRNSIPLAVQQEKKQSFVPRFKYFEEEEKADQDEEVMMDQEAIMNEDLYGDDLQP